MACMAVTIPKYATYQLGNVTSSWCGPKPNLLPTSQQLLTHSQQLAAHGLHRLHRLGSRCAGPAGPVVQHITVTWGTHHSVCKPVIAAEEFRQVGEVVGAIRKVLEVSHNGSCFQGTLSFALCALQMAQCPSISSKATRWHRATVFGG